MKRIVLPGYGNPITLTRKEDSTIRVRADGKLITLKLVAGEPTRIEFLGSIPNTLVA